MEIKTMTQTISKEDILLDKLQTLTPLQQEQVLDFIEFLQSKNEKKIEAKKEEKPQMSAHEGEEIV